MGCAGGCVEFLRGLFGKESRYWPSRLLGCRFRERGAASECGVVVGLLGAEGAEGAGTGGGQKKGCIRSWDGDGSVDNCPGLVDSVDAVPVGGGADREVRHRLVFGVDGIYRVCGAFLAVLQSGPGL